MKTETIQMLLDLKMSGFASKLENQYHEPNVLEMSFEQRLNELLRAELDKRYHSKIERLLKSAKLRYPNARLEDIYYDNGRKLSQNLINNLASCEWVKSNRSVLIMGASGVGKTWLASAFGAEACRNHLTVYFTKAKKLFEDIEDAVYDKKISDFSRKLSRKQLLIIDDLGLGGISQNYASNLLDIIDAQQEVGGLIITSQFTPDVWYKQFEDSALADATLDRIVHRSQEIHISGESIRKEK